MIDREDGMAAQRLPLDGVRVVALEQAVAVPLATRHMADLGADVIKIERPEGDFARSYDSVVNGLSVNFAWLNRGKRSVCLDLKQPDGLEAALKLADGADVFVQNLGPGAARRAGVGAETLRQRNPRLIYCTLSGYGESGPYETRKAYDLLIQGESGAAFVSGTPEEPAKIGISVVDISGGMYVLSSVLAALYEREQTGAGKELSVSLFDSISEWMSVPMLTAKYGGSLERAGLFHNYIAPYGPFRCGRGGGNERGRGDNEGSIGIAIQNQREWARLCTHVLERPELIDDQRFATNEVRYRNRQALGEIIEQVFTRLGLAAAEQRLEQHEIAFGQFRDASELQHHPQHAARKRWQSVASEAGEVELLRSPFDNVSGWETPNRAIPSLGQHTDEVLREIGLSGW